MKARPRIDLVTLLLALACCRDKPHQPPLELATSTALNGGQPVDPCPLDCSERLPPWPERWKLEAHAGRRTSDSSRHRNASPSTTWSCRGKHRIGRELGRPICRPIRRSPHPPATSRSGWKLPSTQPPGASCVSGSPRGLRSNSQTRAPANGLIARTPPSLPKASARGPSEPCRRAKVICRKLKPKTVPRPITGLPGAGSATSA